MATRQVVANEVLYFLSNNFDLFDNDNFIANTSDFYTNEDFIFALKTLKTELETQNLDKLDKLIKIVNAIDMQGIEISTLNNKINCLASKRDNYNFASHSSNISTAIFPEKTTSKLSADKKLIKKSVFAMSNIKKCSRSNVIDYLSEVGIQVISCYPVLKRSLAPSGTLPRNEDEDSTIPNKQGGGVRIFLKDGINYSVLDEVTLSNWVVDYLGIEIKLNNAVIYLYAFYRPPDSDIDLLIQVLNLIFGKLKSKSNTYLVGDFKSPETFS
ncbi:hypothetical protein HELRODRAFT_181259 [Helobdella robusta]|uniref:Uncharacterized protein n=1 Tax=Helobdella robusta TaxID=6412 RepID=T1FGT3_HELRO|nr:hypothetical protein HELRODRAFT_181259 [Helobdella robusta]ESN93151.1 hypothetical protein HELRODRAFT_181259 [Helobdella robusta]